MATENAMQQAASRPIEVTSHANRRTSWSYRPHVDIYDTPDELLLIADVPGANPDTIDISLESGILTLQTEVTLRNHSPAECIAHEYGVGSFHRRFEIDESIDTEAVSAEYRDGALTVHLPKAQQARRRRIPIST
jgi:HSP20 family molecular chaperone IbpA